MVRLTVVAASLLLAMGCSGLIDGGSNGDLTPEEVEARRLWVEKALPQFQTNCVVCHDGSRANIGFLTGGGDLEKRDAIMAYTPTVVNLDAPSSSRALTKGIHEGPALDAIQSSDILEWVNAEKLAGVVTGEEVPRLETAQVLPQICTSGLPDAPGTPNPLCPVNKIPLAELGATGAEIHFVVQSLGSGLYMTNLKLVPAADGAFIDHPLFVAYPDGAAPKADTIDRFFNVKMNLMAAATLEEQTIAGGNAAFVGFFPTDKLSIHFKATSVFKPDEAGPPPAQGCLRLAEFKANAAQPLQTNCASCHAGGANPNAKSAVNMDNLVAANDDDVLLACNQIRTRINFQDLNNSGLYLAPAPANNNHPFRFPTQANHDAFKNAVQIWATAEQTAAP
jgi:mono/diheme cytochrome c family protein